MILFLSGLVYSLVSCGLCAPADQSCLTSILEKQTRYVCTDEGDIKCLPGWKGDTCQDPDCGLQCVQPRGECIEPGQCRCHMGYVGVDCQECLTLPGCRHGTCQRSFECNCDAGYTGMYCSEALCDDGCDLERGYCDAPAGTCRCTHGWEGVNCTECSVLPGCKHGYCDQPLQCKCHQGWSGPFCSVPVCSQECDPQHGRCVHPDTCHCRTGWMGASCTACAPYPGCANGDCSQPWECSCRPGWRGATCDRPEVEKFGDGEREGRCLPLASHQCRNGGEDACLYLGNMTRVGEPWCRCRDGFQGPLCEEEALREDEQPEAKWTKLGDHEHKFFPQEVTQEAARTACQQEGGDLASVVSAEENDKLSGLASAVGWIGGERRDGKWIWTDGTEWDADAEHFHTPDGDGHGDHHGTGDGTALVLGGGRWDVDDAGHKHGYICERPSKGENGVGDIATKEDSRDDVQGDSGDNGTSEDSGIVEDVENKRDNNNSGANEASGNVEESGDIVDNVVTEDSGNGVSNEDSDNNEENSHSLVNEESKDTGTVDGENGDGEEHDSSHEHGHMDNAIPIARMEEDDRETDGETTTASNEATTTDNFGALLANNLDLMGR